MTLPKLQRFWVSDPNDPSNAEEVILPAIADLELRRAVREPVRAWHAARGRTIWKMRLKTQPGGGDHEA